MGVTRPEWRPLLEDGPYEAILLADASRGGWSLVGFARDFVPRASREAFEARLSEALEDKGWVSVLDAAALPGDWGGALLERGEWLLGQAPLPPDPWS